jgi:hypothetical protein
MSKKIAAAAHTLEQQLKAFREMVEKRERAAEQAWADTVPNIAENEAFKRLKVLQDRWLKENL